MATSTIENILADRTEIVPIDSIKQYRKNPRVGNMPAIRESIRENGIFRPLIVQRSTNEIIGGNHTWKAAKAEGYTKMPVVFVDVDDERARKIVLADNRTNDLSTYDTDILAEVLGEVTDIVGTGYDKEAAEALMQGVRDAVDEAAQAVIRPPISINRDDEGEITSEIGNYVGGSAPVDSGSGPAYVKPTDDPGDNDDLSDELGQLQGILQLREDMHFGGSNYYGIPDLDTNMLVSALPDPIDTWGGPDATPDDGVTTWVWNYGVASKKDLPMDRAILCFYTYDTYFEGFWENPAFMVAKVLNAGITMAVVPDFSYYSETSVATWIFNNFRAQWMGRYFQEAGLKVIPRIQYAIDKLDSASLDFNCMGIPVGAPVVAKSSHNANTKDEFDLEVYGLRKSLEKVQPEVLLIYGGNPAKRVIETLDPVGGGLCKEVVHIYNYAHKRRGVVFDKKEGMASAAYRSKKKKEEAARKRDKAHEEDDLALVEAGKGTEKSAEPEEAVL